MPERAADLEGVLDQIERSGRGQERLSLGEVLDAVGRRSFGPFLVVAGLVVLLPVVGDIPGVPSLVALLVVVVAVQVVLGREHLWLPRWLLERSIERRRLDKPLRWIRKPARVADRIIRPRLSPLVSGPASRVVAGACLAIAVVMPAMEIVPFSANLAGIVLLAFGLALVGCDGLVALIGVLVTVAALALTLGHFL